MLLAHTGTTPPRPVQPQDEAAIWLDLEDGSEAERSLVEHVSRLELPSRAEVAEIESSSRLRVEGDVLTLSTPVISRVKGELPLPSPLGFVLSPTRLVTLRWAGLPAFETYAAHLGAGTTAPDSMGAFVGLLEALVDRLADVLEQVSHELDQLSVLIFRSDEGGSRRLSRQDAALRATLRRVGIAGDLLSRLSDSLLGLSRIAGFVPQAAAHWMPAAAAPRFAALRADITSLTEYDNQLTSKVQFLLDATLGFLNIEQNVGIKVLTVVSLVGIPPTLIASIYGMNFKVMPELNWTYGYPYALTLIALSVLVPLGLFKLKG